MQENSTAFQKLNDDNSHNNHSIENIPQDNNFQNNQQQQQIQIPMAPIQQQQQQLPNQMIQIQNIPNQQQQQQFPEQFLYSVPKIPTSRFSQTIFCDNCNKPMETKVNYEIGPGSVLVGALVAFCGFAYGCCLAPCFIDDCKDAQHKCNQCNTNLGKKKFLFDK